MSSHRIETIMEIWFCGDYETNLDWNIDREEIAGLTSYNEANMKATSAIISAVSYEGYCARDTTYQSIRIGSSAQGSITFTLTKDIDAIGFYACAYQNSKDTGKSLLVNDVELEKTLPACQNYEYIDTLRFFKTFDSSTNIITISAKEASNNRFHIYSIGFYSKNNFPDHEGSGGETPIDPDPETPTSTTILPSDGTAIDGGTAGVAYSFTKNGVTVEATGTLTADQIRVFKGKTITITAIGMTKIEFTCTANGTAKYGPGCFAALEGYTYEASGKKGTWTGSANSITLTASTNQVRITQIIVTFTENN